MEAHLQNPSLPNSFDVDGVHKTGIVEWNKKRKSHIDQLDLDRPKHKCWIGNSSSENDSMFDESPPVLESMHAYKVKGQTDAALLDDSSEAESVKDSNSFIEDSNSNTTMSIDEGGKQEADSAKTCLYRKCSTSFVDWDDYNVKDNHCSLDVSAVEKVCSGKEETFDDKAYNPSCHYAVDNLEEHFLGLGGCTDHMYSEYAKDNIEESVDKDFEDIFHSKGKNPNKFVLSSGRWNVDREVQSSSRPPTIDEEFEQYFSMLML